jgi:hypothetical protein
MEEARTEVTAQHDAHASREEPTTVKGKKVGGAEKSMKLVQG